MRQTFFTAPDSTGRWHVIVDGLIFLGSLYGNVGNSDHISILHWNIRTFETFYSIGYLKVNEDQRKISSNRYIQLGHKMSISTLLSLRP